MHLCWSLRLLLLLDLIEGFLLTTRNFVVLCHNSATLADGSFSVNNLLEGRVDVLARVLTNSLFVSNGVRKSTSVTLLLSEQLLSITIDGSKIKGCNPDEKSWGLKLQAAVKNEMNEGTEQVVVHGNCNGICVKRDQTLAKLLSSYENRGDELFVCVEDAAKQFWTVLPLSSSSSSSSTSKTTTTLILGDNSGFNDEEMKTLGHLQKVNFGPTSLLASSVVTLAHHYLDEVEMN